jgi:predicted nucleotidyltransferase
MDKKLYGLDFKTISSLVSIFEKHVGIQKILLYGSRAKGNYSDSSDIDLTLVAPAWDLKRLFKLENEIDDLMLPYKVDLSLLHKISNKNLLEHISRVGIEFYLAK